MARHSERGLNGRFVSTTNTPEAGHHSVHGIESYTDLSFDNAAGAASPYTETNSRFAPSGDQLDGRTSGPRHVVLLDADSGQHLGTVTEDSLRGLIGRRNGNMPLLPGEHDGISYLTRGE